MMAIRAVILGITLTAHMRTYRSTYKLNIRATDEAGKPVACLRAQVDVPRGKSGELFRRVEALRTARRGRTPVFPEESRMMTPRSCGGVSNAWNKLLIPVAYHCRRCQSARRWLT